MDDDDSPNEESQLFYFGADRGSRSVWGYVAGPFPQIEMAHKAADHLNATQKGVDPAKQVEALRNMRGYNKRMHDRLLSGALRGKGRENTLWDYERFRDED